MTPEKIAEAMEVMAEAQSDEPPEGEPRVPCGVCLVEWREGACRA